MMRLFFRLSCLFAAAMQLSACGSGADDTNVSVVFIGSSGDLSNTGVRLSPAGQHLRAATAEGLVALDQSGEVVPALAERWIVTEDGLSYIFRLRNSDWADGTLLSGPTVRNALRRNIKALEGTSLGLDLAKISEIRPMTGRVVEIRLSSPMPQFLQLLAQPELGLRRNNRGTGPMAATREAAAVQLEALSPETRGFPEDENWSARIRTVRLQALSAADAVEAFDDGRVDVVLNGSIANLPLADTGPLSRGTVRLDAAVGLLGLQVVRERGLLAEPARREAIAMAIERETLLEPFNIGGWVPTTRIVASGLPGDQGVIQERWADSSLDARRAEAARRIAAVSGLGDNSTTLRIAMPTGPGSDILLRELAADMATIGITLERAKDTASADLRLVDRLARYGDARWFLNQFNCSLNRGLCSPEADALMRQASATSDPFETARLLAEAEAELTATNAYIPIGAPIRWSQVRGGVDGFSENRWGLHPLFPLALRPI